MAQSLCCRPFQQLLLQLPHVLATSNCLTRCWSVTKCSLVLFWVGARSKHNDSGCMAGFCMQAALGVLPMQPTSPP